MGKSMENPVTVGGTPDNKPRPRSGVFWLLPGLAGGLAIGLLVGSAVQVSPADDTDPAELAAPAPASTRNSTTPVTVVVPEPVTTTTTRQPRLSELVPGFRDRLYLFGWGPTGLTVQTWTQSLPAPIEVDIAPDIDRLEYDARATGVAATSWTGGYESMVLWVGSNPRDLSPVALDVRDFAWHDSAPGAIAWIEDEDGEPVLYTALLSPDGVPDRRRVGALDGLESSAQDLSDLVAFAEWGFLIAGYSEEETNVIILDPDGNRITAPGWLPPYLKPLGRLPDGRHLFTVWEEGAWVTGEDITDSEPLDLGATLAAMSSQPGGELWATVEVGDPAIWDPVVRVRRNDVVVWASEAGLAGSSFAWSSDGQFLIFPLWTQEEPFATTLVFVDVEDWSEYRVPVNSDIHQVVVTP